MLIKFFGLSIGQLFNNKFIYDRIRDLVIFDKKTIPSHIDQIDSIIMTEILTTRPGIINVFQRGTTTLEKVT
ncbi:MULTISPECIES: hypothetical protein [Sphingobacterium]|uniref:hypothetical protein n=1 Tax=Sphingobacterium TaxID=28453 RepID=UPI0025F0EE68|nr:hypothetical protein [Sphingobacterium sp. UBA5670]